MMQSFKLFVFFSFFLFCGLGNIAHSNCETVVLVQPTAKSSQLSIFANRNDKTFIPIRLAKKEYWRPRGTNNEEEDDDDRSAKLKKDKKEHQTPIAISKYLTIPDFLRIAASGDSCLKTTIPLGYHRLYIISNPLHILFQVFRI